MLSLLPALLIFAGWFLERRARKRAERRLNIANGSNAVFESIAKGLLADLKEQQGQNLALAERVAAQSELLSRAAEREQEAARRLGYLFPRGLETPPSREDALSPTWARRCEMRVRGVPCHRTATEMMPDGRHCCSECSKGWTEQQKPLNELPTEDELSAIVRGRDGRILTAAEVIAMGKDPAVEDALSPTWCRENANV